MSQLRDTAPGQGAHGAPLRARELDTARAADAWHQGPPGVESAPKRNPLTLRFTDYGTEQACACCCGPNALAHRVVRPSNRFSLAARRRFAKAWSYFVEARLRVAVRHGTAMELALALAIVAMERWGDQQPTRQALLLARLGLVVPVAALSWLHELGAPRGPPSQRILAALFAARVTCMVLSHSLMLFPFAGARPAEGPRFDWVRAESPETALVAADLVYSFCLLLGASGLRFAAAAPLALATAAADLALVAIAAPRELAFLLQVAGTVLAAGMCSAHWDERHLQTQFTMLRRLHEHEQWSDGIVRGARAWVTPGLGSDCAGRVSTRLLLPSPVRCVRCHLLCARTRVYRRILG